RPLLFGLFPPDAVTQCPHPGERRSIEIVDGLLIPTECGSDLRNVFGAQGDDLRDVAKAGGEGRRFVRAALGASAGGLPALASEDDQRTAQDEGLGSRLVGLRHRGSFLFYLLAYRLT